MSCFLFMVTVNDCFILFFYLNQTQKTAKAQSTRPQKQALKNTFTLTLLPVKYGF